MAVEKPAQQPSKEKSKPKKRFLRIVFAVGHLFLGLGGLDVSNTRESKPKDPIENVANVEAESEVTVSDRLLVIDTPLFTNVSDVVRNLMGEDFSRRVPFDGTTTRQLLEDDETAPTAMLEGLVLQMASAHYSTIVRPAMQRVIADTELTWSDPEIFSIFNTLTGYEFSRDSLGNPIISVSIDLNLARPFLEANPEQSVVNLSLQPGIITLKKELYQEASLEEVFFFGYTSNYEERTFLLPDVPSTTIYEEQTDDGGVQAYYLDESGERIYFEGPISEEEWGLYTRRPTIEVSDLVFEPFHPETAYENVLSLIELCNDFPDKLFVVAGGTYGSNIAEARSDIEEWPSNLLIVGTTMYEGSIEDMRNGDVLLRTNAGGSDVFLNGSWFSQEGLTGTIVSSSEATAIVSSYAAILSNEGRYPADVIDLMVNRGTYSDVVSVRPLGINGVLDSTQQLAMDGRLLNPVALENLVAE
jgi:hypothetical protein